MKRIIFDVGTPVIKWDYAITYGILEQMGVKPKNARKFYLNDDYLEFSRGNITGQQFYEALVTKHLKRKLTFQQVRDSHDAELYEVDFETLDILKKIPRDRLAFLTDTNEWQTAKERMMVDLTDYSDEIFRSHEIRMLKIDEGCFPFIAGALGALPHELLLVDDNPEKLAMAANHGFRTLEFKNAGQAKQELTRLNPI